LPPPLKALRTGPMGRRPAPDLPSGAAEHRRRRTALGAGGLVVLAAAAVAASLLAGGSHRHQAPIAAYLAGHVPRGTEVLALGPMGALNDLVPGGYPTLNLAGADLVPLARATFVVGPDPITKAGPSVAAFVRAHASLVATDPGAATLWKLTAPAPPAPAPTSAAPAPPAPAPTSAAPAPAAPAPAAPAPSGASPAATTAPPPAAPAPSPGTTATAYTVSAGQSFWSIAQSVLTQRLGHSPSAGQVADYWARLVAANSGHLPVPSNPNLLYPGSIVLIPTG
jgi:nucleoid-associated protein YgaU